MERAAADYDAASKRYLGHGKRWRSDAGDKNDKARMDMMQAEACSHILRCMSCRQIWIWQPVQGRLLVFELEPPLLTETSCLP